MVDKFEKFEDNLEELKKWIATSNLPKNLNELFLQKYLQCTKGDVEKAIEMLTLAFEIRTKNQHLFSNREKSVDEYKDICEMVTVPVRSSDNLEYTIYRMIDSDPDKIIFDEIIKAFWVIMDFRLINPEMADMADGSVAIVDMKKSTFRHIFKLVIQTFRTHFKYFMHAQPVKAEQLHVINCPSFINSSLKVLKPLLPTQIYECIHLHTEYEKTLYDFVSKDCLPLEYGGNLESINVLKDRFAKQLEQYGDYLYNDDNWRFVSNSNDTKNIN